MIYTVLKVKYRRFPDFPNLFSKQICSSKTDFSTFSSSKKGTSTQPLSPTKISRRFGPKRASYIRIIGGNVSYIGFIGNIGGLSGLGLSFSSLSTSCSLCSLLRGKQNCWRGLLKGRIHKKVCVKSFNFILQVERLHGWVEICP